MTEFIGWGSSIILLVTLVVQIRKQWKMETNEGVSKWLFVGQTAASLGFLVYSVLTGEIVFAFTNLLLTISNCFGIYIYLRNRSRAAAN
jgi:MtN3 and saliva related transmembrane protein